MKKILFLFISMNLFAVGSFAAEESASGSSEICENKDDKPVAPVRVTVKPPESETTTATQKINGELPAEETKEKPSASKRD